MLSNINNIQHQSPMKSPRRYVKDLPYDEEALTEIERIGNQNLDKKWLEKAEKELGETPDISQLRIQQLRQLLLVSHNSLRGRTDDAFMLRFLRAKKFDVDKSFRMIQKYYTMKQKSPELFKVSPPSQMKNILEMQIQKMLPLRDINGRQIYIFRVEKCDPSKCPVEMVFRSNVLSLEHAVREPETQIGGLVVLLDMSGLGLGHARFLSPHLAKRTVEVIQEAFPLRFKAFHVLNEPFYFDAILAVLKPFLKEKIRRRIHLHGSNLTSLHRFIPKEILPIEYGGVQPPFDNTQWRTKILTDENYFIHLETYTSDNDSENGTPVNSFSDADCASIPYIDTETEDSEFEEDVFYPCEKELDDKTPVGEKCYQNGLLQRKENGYKQEKEVEDTKELK